MNQPAKQIFTVERAYLLPVYQHVNVEAASPDEAARLALDLDDWEDAEKDYDSSRAVYIDGIWEGEDADYSGEAHPIPADLRNPERVNEEFIASITADNVEALRSTLAAAVEDLDHWEHNGSADEAESREARRVTLDNAHVFIERLAAVASGVQPDPDNATDEDRIAAILEINESEGDNMGSEVADYMVRAAQCSTKSGLRAIIKEAGPIGVECSNCDGVGCDECDGAGL